MSGLIDPTRACTHWGHNLGHLDPVAPHAHATRLIVKSVSGELLQTRLSRCIRERSL